MTKDLDDKSATLTRTGNVAKNLVYCFFRFIKMTHVCVSGINTYETHDIWALILALKLPAGHCYKLKHKVALTCCKPSLSKFWVITLNCHFYFPFQIKKSCVALTEPVETCLNLYSMTLTEALWRWVKSLQLSGFILIFPYIHRNITNSFVLHKGSLNKLPNKH